MKSHLLVLPHVVKLSLDSPHIFLIIEGFQLRSDFIYARGESDNFEEESWHWDRSDRGQPRVEIGHVSSSSDDYYYEITRTERNNNDHRVKSSRKGPVPP